MPQQYDWSELESGYDWSELENPQKEQGWFDWGIEQALRTGPAVIGGIGAGLLATPETLGFGTIPAAMAGGGAGAALGQYLGDWYSGKESTPLEYAVTTGAGAIPGFLGPSVAKTVGGRLLGNAARGALEGAVTNVATSPFEEYAQTGRWVPSAERVGKTALVGAAFGAPIGAGAGHLFGPPREAAPKPIVESTPPPPPASFLPPPPRQSYQDMTTLGGQPMSMPEPIYGPEVGPYGTPRAAGIGQENMALNEIQSDLPFGAYRGDTGRFTNEGPGMPPRMGPNVGEFPPRRPLSEQLPLDLENATQDNLFGSPPPTTPPSNVIPQKIDAQGPQVVTITNPNAAETAILRQQGYVTVPNLRSPEGYVMMVRGDVAPLYVTGDKQLPTPSPAPQPVIRPEIPSAMGPGQVAATGNPRIPNERVSQGFIQEMAKGGYIPINKDATHTTFREMTPNERANAGLEEPEFSRTRPPDDEGVEFQPDLDLYNQPHQPGDVNTGPPAPNLPTAPTLRPGNWRGIDARTGSIRVLNETNLDIAERNFRELDQSLAYAKRGGDINEVNKYNYLRDLALDHYRRMRDRAGVGETVGPTPPRGTPEEEGPLFSSTGNEPPDQRIINILRQQLGREPTIGEIQDMQAKILEFTPKSSPPYNPANDPSLTEGLTPTGIPGRYVRRELQTREGPLDPETVTMYLGKGVMDADAATTVVEIHRIREYWRKFIDEMDENVGFNVNDPAVQRLLETINAKYRELLSTEGARRPVEAVPGADTAYSAPRGQQNLALLGDADSGAASIQNDVRLAGWKEKQRGYDAEQMLREPLTEPQQQSMIPMFMDEEARQYFRNQGIDVSGRHGIEPEEGPSFARIPGKGLTASVNITRAVDNITKDYTGALSGVMDREAKQNAMDAAELMGEAGVVKTRYDPTNNTIEIYDNGKGLYEDMLANKLIEIFSTGKEGEAGATGGKGIGSASYIYGGKHFEIDTIAVDPKDGKKYQIIAGGTPEQFLDPVKGSDYERIPVPDDTPTGTTIKITLKDTQHIYDAKSMSNKIIANSRDRKARIIIDSDNSTKGTPLKDVEPGVTIDKYGLINDLEELTIGKSSDDKMIGDFTTQSRNSEIKVLIPKEPTHESSHIDVHYLNNGMYQFSETMFLNEKADVPSKVLVDIHPLVDDADELYPFINTREDIKKDIRQEVDNFLKDNISRPALSSRKNRVQELYDSMTFTPVGGTKRKPVIYDPGLRLTPQEMDTIVASPYIQDLIRTFDNFIDDILVKSGKQKWSNRLEGVGIVMDPNMHGVHIPNPTTGKSTILINPFTGQDGWNTVLTNVHEVAHIGKDRGSVVKLSPADYNDPRIGQFLKSYMDELTQHGDIGFFSTGHGMDFAQRLSEVYAATGVQGAFDAAAKIDAIVRRHSAEHQRLSQLYTESRGRDATVEDLLSGTGVKQANRGRKGTEDVSGNPEASGDGSTWRERTGIGMGNAAKKKKDEINWVTEAIELSRSATTTMDLSAPGRQGLSLILTPQFWKAASAMFGGLSESGFNRIDADLRSKPIMQRPIDLETGKVGKSIAEKIGTKIFSPASKPGPRAEGVASKWLETGGNIPFLSAAYRNTIGVPVRMSNRAYITFLNHLNINRTEYLMNKARDMAIEAFDTGSARPGLFRQKFTPEEAMNLNPYHNLTLGKDIADFVNTATGHGPLKTHLYPHKSGEVSLEAAASKLGAVLFSPGLLASRIRMLNPNTYVMAPPFVRKQYMKAALSTAAAWGAFTTLSKMAGGEVGEDPTSADFGKVRIGDTRIDAGGGFLQFLVLMSRMYQGGYTSSATGEFHRFGEGFQAETQLSNFMRFASNKLNPVAKFAYDLANATDYQPFHVKDRMAQLVTPLYIQDIMGIAEENPDLVPWLVPMIFGVGSQTYSKGESVGKIINPENDIIYGGGGFADLGPDYLHPRLDY